MNSRSLLVASCCVLFALFAASTVSASSSPSPLAFSLSTTASSCSAYTNCSTCTADPSCGWCLSSLSCIGGDKSGPSNDKCFIYYFDQCSKPEIELTASAIAISIILLCSGVLLTFVGYRLFKPTIFLGGFLSISFATWVLMQHYATSTALVDGIVALVCGILAGLLLLYILHVGIFTLGALGGASLAVAVLTLKNGTLVNSVTIQWVIIALTATVGGIAALSWQKHLLIVSTSLAGSFSILVAIDRFAKGDWSNQIRLLLQSHGENVQVSQTTYLVIGGWFVLAVIGCAIQFQYTGKKYNHQKSEIEESLLDEETADAARRPLITPASRNPYARRPAGNSEVSASSQRVVYNSSY